MDLGLYVESLIPSITAVLVLIVLVGFVILWVMSE